MAKMNVTVDNDLENVELVSNDQLNKKNKKKKETKRKEKNKNKKQGYFEKIGEEMGKVTWPTKKNLIKYSLTTIGMIVLLSLFFIALSALFDLLYALVQGWIG